MTTPIIAVDGLSKRYVLGVQAGKRAFFKDAARAVAEWSRGRRSNNSREIWALKDVSFTIRQGERVGIIGRNGAGKSTLLKILSRVVYPTRGEAVIDGRLTSLLEVGTGFNEQLTGRQNIHMNASLHGLTRAEIEERLELIVAFAEISRFIDTPVKNYSSGMRMRLAFSVAAHLDPDILLLDEVLAVGDLSFQRKCLERVEGMTQHGQTLLFVSHSMDSMMRYCDRCIWLDGGLVRMDGDVQDVTSAYVEDVMGVRSETTVSSPSSPIHSEATEIVAPPTSSTTPQKVSSPGQLVAAASLEDDEPGARLLNAEIIDGAGHRISLAPCDSKVGVRFSYEVLDSDLMVPSIALFCPQGSLVFHAVPGDTNEEAFRLTPGKYVATAWIPPHLLNTGAYSVTLQVSSPNRSPIKRHFVLHQGLSFVAVDVPHASRLARGIMPRPFPGPLRPLLEWESGPLEVRETAVTLHA